MPPPTDPRSAPPRRGPSRRSLLVVGAGVVAVGGAIAYSDVTRPATGDPIPYRLPQKPTTGPVLQLAHTSAMQCIVRSSDAGEFYVTQAKAGTSGLLDATGAAIGDVVLSRCSPTGALLDSMTLQDAGHGMSFAVVRDGDRMRLYIGYAHPAVGRRSFDVVTLIYAPGTVTRADCTTVVAGPGYPLDVSYDAVFGTATMRHQGGGQPEYTRHRWSDFLKGDLTRRTGALSTPDFPPTQQGFCSLGDAFFFSTGALNTNPDADPPQLSEYSWSSGSVVLGPIDTSALTRRADGRYPGGSFEPESATIYAETTPSGTTLHLLVGVVTGGGTSSTGKTFHTFGYPLRATATQTPG